MESSKGKRDTPQDVGGQAVIEGVMMRAPLKISIAVRAPDGSIVLDERSYTSLSKRYRILNTPIFRGAVSLFEMMIIGIRALKFSADIAAQEIEEDGGEKVRTKDKKRDTRISPFTMGLLMVAALGIGVLVFFYVPLWLTSLFHLEHNGFLFNLVDGTIRIIFFIVYIIAISMMKDIRRIFEYHGAEHKTIFAWESGDELSVENSRKFQTLHPRCGTSFLMVVFVTAFFLHIVIDSIFQGVTGHPPGFQQRFLLHLPLLPLIAGIAYELIRAAGRKKSRLLRIVVYPGLLLQKITTREPSEDQIEVAIHALRSALGKE